jgi:hypothetical protein
LQGGGAALIGCRILVIVRVGRLTRGRIHAGCFMCAEYSTQLAHSSQYGPSAAGWHYHRQVTAPRKRCSRPRWYPAVPAPAWAVEWSLTTTRAHAQLKGDQR